MNGIKSRSELEYERLIRTEKHLRENLVRLTNELQEAKATIEAVSEQFDEIFEAPSVGDVIELARSYEALDFMSQDRIDFLLEGTDPLSATDLEIEDQVIGWLKEAEERNVDGAQQLIDAYSKDEETEDFRNWKATVEAIKKVDGIEDKQNFFEAVEEVAEKTKLSKPEAERLVWYIGEWTGVDGQYETLEERTASLDRYRGEDPEGAKDIPG